MKSNYGFFVIAALILGLIIYFIFAAPNFALFFESGIDRATSGAVAAANASSSKSGFFNFGIYKRETGSIASFGPAPRSPYYEKNYGALSGGTIISSGGNASENIIPPEGFTREQLSPYYGQVVIAGVSHSSIYAPYSRASIAAKSGDQINISGWRIQNKWDSLPPIPQAIADFQPFGSSARSDIILTAGQTVNLYSGRSANGLDFRLNKCTGYLNNYYNFEPDLPNACPALDKSGSRLFSSACQDFARSIYGCRVPTANELNRFAGANDGACHAFLESINYGGCYQEHRADSGFFSNEWRIWLNRNFDFDRRHDRLLLFDENNLLVDEYSY